VIGVSNCPFQAGACPCEDGIECKRRFPNISINMERPDCYKNDERQEGQT
jgi:hypothetical protein